MLVFFDTARDRPSSLDTSYSPYCPLSDPFELLTLVSPVVVVFLELPGTSIFALEPMLEMVLKIRKSR